VGGYPITDAAAATPVPFPPLPAPPSRASGGKSASGKPAKTPNSKTPTTGDKRKAPIAPQAGTVAKQTNNAMDSARKAQKVQTAVIQSQSHSEIAELPPSAQTYATTGMCLHTLSPWLDLENNIPT
jgi:hypothetical protein